MCTTAVTILEDQSVRTGSRSYLELFFPAPVSLETHDGVQGCVVVAPAPPRHDRSPLERSNSGSKLTATDLTSQDTGSYIGRDMPCPAAHNWTVLEISS